MALRPILFLLIATLSAGCGGGGLRPRAPAPAQLILRVESGAYADSDFEAAAVRVKRHLPNYLERHGWSVTLSDVIQQADDYTLWANVRVVDVKTGDGVLGGVVEFLPGRLTRDVAREVARSRCGLELELLEGGVLLERERASSRAQDNGFDWVCEHASKAAALALTRTARAMR